MFCILFVFTTVSLDVEITVVHVLCFDVFTCFVKITVFDLEIRVV